MDLLNELSKSKKLEYLLIEEIKQSFTTAHASFYSERELIEKYEINRTTVRQVLKSLADKGYIYRVSGKGTFISPQAKIKHILIVQTVKGNPFESGSYAQIQLNSGITRAVQEEDLPFIIVPIDRNYFLEILDEITLIYKNISGVIFYSDISPLIKSRDFLENKNIPYMFFGSNMSVRSGFKNYVVYNQETIITQALDHLYENGHRNIGFVYTSNVEVRIQRFREYQKWMKRKGLTISENGVLDLKFDRMGTRERKHYEIHNNFKELLPVEGITAFLCSDDLLAQYMVNSSINLGFNIPDDFSIISINNYPFCQDIIIPLTSVAIPFYEGGKEALKILLNKLENNRSTTVTLPAEVVKRDTVKKI